MSDAPRDAQLAARLKAGEMAAFEELYRLHGPRVYALACRMLDDAADAEDLLQEVFLLVFRKVGGFKGESALGTWVYRLAMNLCVDRLRSRAGKQDRQTESLDAQPEGHGPSATSRLLPGVIAQLDLERAIARLPDGARAAFLLHDVEGFDHREVGAILGIAEGTSKSQVHKARMLMRAFLGGAAPASVAAAQRR